MKKLIIAVCLASVFAVTARAAEGEIKKEDGEKKKPTAEQKALRKELTEKYDTNKNGRLDKEEKSKMTSEDAEKWKSITPSPRKKPAASEPQP